MREHNELSQTELGSMVGMNQNAIHRLESPDYGKATLTTLKRLAAAFDVALVVRFVPFSQIVDWISGTPYVEQGISSAALTVPSFEEEMNEGVLAEQAVCRTATINSGQLIGTFFATSGLEDQVQLDAPQNYTNAAIAFPNEFPMLPISGEQYGQELMQL